MADYSIRKAEEEDCEEIMRMIVELAEFEKMSDQVRIDANGKMALVLNAFFQCLVAETGKTPEEKKMVGYCLFYYIYSTWEGKACYMEDLYVTPQWRSKSIGTALWVETTKIALSTGCSRLHWAVLDWNQGAIDLYKRRGGLNLTQAEGWNLFRMTKPVMQDFVSQHGAKP